MRRTATRRARAAALPLLAAALLASGCGGDGDDPDPRGDFQKQADRICLRSGIRPQAVPNDLRAAARQLADEARLRGAVHDKLAALEPPADLHGDYARFLQESDRVRRDLDRMAALARAGREAELGELGRRTGLRESARLELGKRLGFLRCGRPLTDPVRAP